MARLTVFLALLPKKVYMSERPVMMQLILIILYKY